MIFRDHALEYVDDGIPVFPVWWLREDGSCACKGRAGCSPGKHPLTPNGFKDATTSRQVVDAWRKVYPNANIASPLAEDEVVIDIDPRNGGDESLAQLEAKYGAMPRTFTVRTGGGGWQRRFSYSGPAIKWKKTLAAGIDLKVAGGYVVVPPSKTAAVYKVVDDAPLAEVPAWVIELGERVSNGHDSQDDHDRVDTDLIFAGIPEGQRNIELFRYACSMRARNLRRAEAVQLLGIAMSTCSYTEETAEHMVDRVWETYAPGDDYEAIEVLTDAEKQQQEQEEAEDTLPAFPDAAWRGVFADYRELMHDISECPDVFHYANALTFVGSIAGDKFRLSGGNAPYLNFYTLCLGKSGIKKSTATDLFVEYILDKLSGAYTPYVITSVSSTEGLIRILNENPNVFLAYDEIAKLMKVVGWSGSTLDSTLCEAINLKTLHSNVKKERESLEADDYYLSLLACGTPAHIRLKMTEDTFSGGLLNRFLVFAAKPTGITKPVMGTPDDVLNRYIVQQLHDILQAWSLATPGGLRFIFSPEAAAIHAKWYTAHTKMMQGGDDLRNDPLTRLDFYVKKIAMVYCFLENAKTGDPYITGEQMQAACEVIAYCKASMLWMTRDWTGPKTIQQQSQHISEQQVEAHLRENGCTNERDLYRGLRVSAGELRMVLKDMDGITVTIEGKRPRMIHYIGKCRCSRKEQAA